MTSTTDKLNTVNKGIPQKDKVNSIRQQPSIMIQQQEKKEALPHTPIHKANTTEQKQDNKVITPLLNVCEKKDNQPEETKKESHHAPIHKTMNIKYQKQNSKNLISSPLVEERKAEADVEIKEDESKGQTIGTLDPPNTDNQIIKLEKQNDTIMVRPQGVVLHTLATQLDAKEIDDLKRYHDNSLAAASRKAYRSDYNNFIEFLFVRFPELEQKETDGILEPQVAYLQKHCTLEHVLAYLNQMCNDGKKIATINRRLSAIKKHILPLLFNKLKLLQQEVKIN
jgi:hypothetical protein